MHGHFIPGSPEAGGRVAPRAARCTLMIVFTEEFGLHAIQFSSFLKMDDNLGLS